MSPRYPTDDETIDQAARLLAEREQLEDASAYATQPVDDDFSNDPVPAADQRLARYHSGEDVEDDEPPARQQQERDDQAPAGESEEEERQVVGGEADDEFERIARRQNEALTTKAKVFDGDLSRPENTVGQLAGDDGESEAGPGEEQPPADDPNDPPITMTVRGQQITKRQSEWFADGQKVEAADSYLAEARAAREEAARLLREANELGGRAARGESIEETAEERERAERGLSEQGKRDRREFIEKIQYGTPEDAAEAFQALEQDITERVIGTIRQKAEAAQSEQRYQQAKLEGEEWVARTIPDLAASPSHRSGFQHNFLKIQREFMASLVENSDRDQQQRFAAVNLTPQNIRAISSPELAEKLYRQFHDRGYALPPVNDLIKSTAIATAYDYGLAARPAGQARGTAIADDAQSGRVQPPLAAREARKGGLTPQPMRSSTGTGRTPQTRRTSESEYHARAVDEMREEGQGFVPRRR